MFRPLARSHRRPHRRGTSFVLIVVVMISFAASVGVAFALFAGQTLRINRAHLEGQGGGGLPQVRAPEPSAALNQFFSALLFDVGDDTNPDLTNALRGHSIARSMYGRDVAIAQSATPWANLTPWAGVGTFREPNAYGDRSAQVNYTQMLFGTAPFLLDPEVRGARPFDATTTPATRQPLRLGVGREYVGKHAGYSYADLKDFFAGAVDAGTGQVTVPSFHRPWLWNTAVTTGTTTTITTLGPDNPNWTSNEGRFKTLRPRPAEHPRFPRVPQNVDGTFTGDVQNWPGGFTFDAAGGRYVARNDSLWMHIGLPTVSFGNRKVQPVVAPLIVPLDGLFNASVHGNNYGPVGAGGLGTHVSHSGFGPHEVNISGAVPSNSELAAILTDRATVVGARGNLTGSRAFDPYRTAGVPLPAYAPVAWNSTPVNRPIYPTGSDLRGIPDFTGFQNTNTAELGHPAQFSPTQWSQFGAAGTPRVFPVSDIKRMHLRYAFTPDWYALSDLATQYAPTDLFGAAATFPFSYATGMNTAHSYRLDPAHANRALITTHSYSLDRPKVAPNFANRDATGLALPPGARKPGPVSPGPYPIPGLSAIGAITDFPANDRWVNKMAALGAVDLNRPLTDYRANTTQPLSATNVANAAQADADRRKLAHDIFVRLAAATGASLQIGLSPTTYPQAPIPQPQYTVPVAAGTPQYDALRYLAQLAVNIVDYRDDDDISTVFVWNPVAPATPDDVANFATAADIGNRVVFGVEKPRLVINEVYSEITNAPTDLVTDNPPAPLPPNSRAHVKFWAELLNPTTVANSTGTGPIADTVPLVGYQIEIARANRVTGAAAAEDTVSALSLPNNPTGSFGIGPDAIFTFGAAAPVTGVNPNGGAYAPPSAGPAPNVLPANGIVLVAPPMAPDAANPKMGSQEFNPPDAGVWSAANAVRTPPPGPAKTSTGLGYTLDMGANAGTVVPGAVEYRRHVVLLRRLANPYLPPSTNAALTSNQYVTVDVMDYVPSFDAIHRDVGQMTDRGPRSVTVPNGFDPVAERFSVGKVQPYAGLAFTTPVAAVAGTPNYNTYTFPTSMVLAQTTPPDATSPKSTFGRHNGTQAAAAPANSWTAGTPAVIGTETIMTPFDWMVHLDRTLINEIELFQVRDTPPHRVTDQFLQPSAVTPGVTYESGYGRWQFTNNGIGRALEYLTVKPHMSGVAHGGRVPGKVGINALTDKRVANGLLDPQPGNYFDENYVTTRAWNTWMASRGGGAGGVITRQLANGTTIQTTADPGQSIYDGTGGPNRPFQSVGAPAVTADPTGFAYIAGGDENLTILRNDGAAPPQQPQPLLYTGLPAPGATYVAPEPLRKIRNNITEVNHTYVVFLTIGYFELDTVNGALDLGAGVTMPRLAQEAYLNVPGDMRQKFMAVIDMSNMAIDPVTNGPAAHPFFTTLEATARPGATVTLSIPTDASGNVLADGTPVAIVPGTTKLVLGYGVEEQVVDVTAVGPGQVTVANLTRTAWAGSSVSNVRAGYPGVQSGFRYNDPIYKPVIPFLKQVK